MERLSGAMAGEGGEGGGDGAPTTAVDKEWLEEAVSSVWTQKDHFIIHYMYIYIYFCLALPSSPSS